MDVERSASRGAVFLSYASQDAEAVRRIAEALRAAGVEVWFDQNELVGGDAWDAKIRGQIASCALFVPVISASTEARLEGYFRIEWKLAAQRTHAMAEEKAFLLPVVIDATRDADAKVPAEFRAVQWTRLRSAPGGPALDDASIAALAGRVRTLLENDAAPSVGGSRAEFSGRVVPPRASARNARPRKWLAPVAVGVVAVGAALIFWRPRDQPKNPESASAGTPQTAEVQPVPLSPARQLTVKARRLFENPNNTRDDLVLAEDYCKQALKLDDADVEVWATYAELSSEFLAGRADTSLERREMARFQAERAMRLAPASVTARFAKACYLRRVGGPTERAEAEQLLRQLAQERPHDPRVLNALGKAIGGGGRRLDHADEALAVLARAAAIPAGRAEALSETGWILYNLDRFTEAEAAIDASLADQTSRAALWVKVNLTIERGAAADAQAALAKMPPDTIRSDAGVALATRVWLFSRQPEKVLGILSGVTRDYLSSNTGGGVPVDLTRGLAYQQQGKTQAAENAWNAALRVVNKLIEEQSRNEGLQFIRAQLLALLKKPEEAVAAMRLWEEIRTGGLLDRNNQITAIAVWALIEPPDRAIARLEAVLKGGKSGMLRIDPRFDMLRGHSRFEALLPEAPKPAMAITASEANAKSVAVLAFENLSGEKGNEYFSDGISDELINVLGRVEGLQVIARTSSFSFKGRAIPATEIGRALNTSHLVEGTVQRVGAKARVIARLLRTDTGAQVWSQRFDQDLSDIFAAQDAVAGAIANALSLRLSEPRAGAAARAVDPAAYELYARGRQAWNERTAEGLVRADRYFAEAVTRDASFARAYVGLADVWLQGGKTGRVSSEADALGMVRKALELEPELAEGHASLATLYSTSLANPRYDDAEREFETALRLNPSYASAHQWRARYLEGQGRIGEALAGYSRAVQLDPLSTRIADNHGRALLLAGQADEALAEFARALRLEPGNTQARRWRAWMLWERGQREEAVQEARQLAGSDVDSRPMASAILYRQGLRAEADAVFALSDPREPRAWPHYLLPIMSRGDDPLPALGAASPMRRDNAVLMFFLPSFDLLHADPRFRAWVKQAGLQEAFERALAWRAAHPPTKTERK